MKKRSLTTEILFWILLLGLDALALYLIHREYGEPNFFFMDTMPVMFCVGALVPLLAAVFRCLPRRKGLRIGACCLSVLLAAAIGIGALYACYTDEKINFYYWKLFGRFNGKAADDAKLLDLCRQGYEGRLPIGEVEYGDKLVFCWYKKSEEGDSLDSSFETAAQTAAYPDALYSYGDSIDLDRMARNLKEADTAIVYYALNEQISTVNWRERNTSTQEQYSFSVPVYGTHTMMFAVDLGTNTASEPVSVAYREPEDTSPGRRSGYSGGIDSGAVYSAVFGAAAPGGE